MAGRSLPYGRKINIIHIKLDDAPIDFASVGFPQTIAANYLGGWVDFESQARVNATISLCAPGRASGLTGVLPQFHHMVDNTSNEDGGVFDFTKTYIKDLARVGYYNGIFDKWMNGYGESGNGGFDFGVYTPRQPGAHYQAIQYGAPSYDDYSLADGVNTPVAYLGTDTANYITDVIGAKIMDFLNTRPVNRPFSIYWGSKASHQDAGDQFTPPDRYDTTSISYTNNPAFGLDPTLPEYNQPGWIVDDADPTWSQTEVDFWNAIHLDKHRCHYAVDEWLKTIMDYLNANNLLDKTMIIVSTDNAANVGEFRQQSAKGSMLKSANDIVMYVRAPVAAGSANKVVANSSVSDMDVAATIYHVSGARSQRTLNGQSFVPLLQDVTAGHRAYAPYHNRWKDSPVAEGVITNTGRVSGWGLAVSEANGNPGDAAGQSWSWSDRYNLYNTGENKEDKEALEIQKVAISKWDMA